MSFGGRVRKEREARGLTQADLAKALNVSVPTIADYEADKKKPRPEKIVLLAKKLGVSTDYLLGATKVKEPADYLQKLLQEKVMDLGEITKYKRQTPTFRGRPITEEEAREWNKIFDIFLDLLEAKMERDEKNAKSGMIDNAS